MEVVEKDLVVLKAAKELEVPFTPKEIEIIINNDSVYYSIKKLFKLGYIKKINYGLFQFNKDYEG